MKTHTQIYLIHYGYDETDFIGCELCGNKAVDIHHLVAERMGGSKTKDDIENLIAVCRECQNKCHSNKYFNDRAKIMHDIRIDIKPLSVNQGWQGIRFKIPGNKSFEKQVGGDTIINKKTYLFLSI